MKYRVLKACGWKTWNVVPPKGGKPLVIDAADLKTADGTPLPPDVVARLVKSGSIVEEKEAE